MCEWFAETTLVAGVLAVVAAIATRSGRIGPAARHALWLVVLLKMIMPPVLHWPTMFPAIAQETSISVVVGNEDLPTVECVALEESPAIERFLGDDDLVPELALAQNDESLEPVSVVLLSAPPVPPEPPPAIEFVALPPSEEDTEATLPSWQDRVTAWAPLLRRAALPVWAIGAAVFGAVHLVSIVRFGRSLRFSKPVPEWLEDAIIEESSRFDVRPPRSCVVDQNGSPFLWCAGRTLLVVPSSLLGKIDEDRWRAILAHEIAHLRRGDAWTCRVALAAGILWWWNPLYWIVRNRLAVEAELACDALTVSTLPGSRRAFAEALVAVCEVMSARPASPALGVGGEGRFLERRLSMILKGRDTGRLPATGLCAAVMMMGLATPSWSALTQDEPAPPAPPAAPAAPSAPEAPKPPVPPEPPAPPEPPPEIAVTDGEIVTDELDGDKQVRRIVIRHGDTTEVREIPLPEGDEGKPGATMVRRIVIDKDGKLIQDNKLGPEAGHANIERLEKQLRMMEEQHRKQMEAHELRMRKVMEQLERSRQAAGGDRPGRGEEFEVRIQDLTLELERTRDEMKEGPPEARKEREIRIRELANERNRIQAEAREMEGRPNVRGDVLIRRPGMRGEDGPTRVDIRRVPQGIIGREGPSPDRPREVRELRVEGRRVEGGEVENLNRRMDQMEKKLDMLLKKLEGKDKPTTTRTEETTEVEETEIKH